MRRLSFLLDIDWLLRKKAHLVGFSLRRSSAVGGDEVASYSL